MQNILFMEKVFLHPAKKAPGGVELFNLSLLRDLSGLGYRITAPAHRSWAPLIKHADSGSTPALEFFDLPGNLADMAGGLAALWQLRRRRFDLALLGNAGDRLIPLLLFLRRMSPRFGLIAHREPSARFVRALRALPVSITAWNGQIAAHFIRGGIAGVRVDYGILRRFVHLGIPAPRATVNFCVLGHLERSLKGHDTVVAAFERLPPDAAGAMLFISGGI